jgi:hypothetical protein
MASMLCTLDTGVLPEFEVWKRNLKNVSKKSPSMSTNVETQAKYPR